MPNFNVIGVLPLPDTLGERTFDEYLNSILLDLDSLQSGGIDLILVENEGDKATDRRAPPQTISLMERVLERLEGKFNVPYLIGVLPADYEASFDFAKRFNAFGVWMDVLVDRASPTYTESSVLIDLDLEDVLNHKFRQKLFAEIQPRNFYEILSRKILEQSAYIAKLYADAICMVGRDEPPSLALVKKIRKIVGPHYHLGITGKLTMDNVDPYVNVANFGVFFSYLRENGSYEKPIDVKRVRNLMQKIRNLT